MRGKITKISFALGAAVLVSVSANAATFGSGAYFETSSTTESNGFRCGDFSFSAGIVSECVGTAYYETDERVASFDYSSKGLSSAGALKTESSLTYRPEVTLTEEEYFAEDVRPLPSYVTSYGSANFRDDWTISGGEDGASGTLVLTYEVDGTNLSPSINDTGVSSTTILWLRELMTTVTPGGTTVTSAVPGSGTLTDTGFNGMFDGPVDLEIGITFGEQLTIDLLMASHSTIEFFGDSLTAIETSSDFFSTALLGDIRVLDSGGNEIDFLLVSASGETAFESFSTLDVTGSVPTAPVWVLWLMGALAYRAWRASSTA